MFCVLGGFARHSTSTPHDVRNHGIIVPLGRHRPSTIMATLRQSLGTFIEEGPHPSRGGNPYSDDYRNDVITRYQLGNWYDKGLW